MVPSAHEAPRDPIGIESLTDRRYGPLPLRVCREKVEEFVAVTGDDPRRWRESAPPGWAAVPLFVVAPLLLNDPDLASDTGGVIHGEQRFTWQGEIGVESDLEVSGRVDKVRERGGVWFVTFEFVAGPVEGVSTFLVSGSAPAGGEAEEREQLEPHERQPGQFAASRSDLIAYAAATRDWNPIHWDHRSAVAAGLGGIVVHGLLQSAWILRSVVATHSHYPQTARFRYRAPLRVGESASLDLEEPDSPRLKSGDRELVSASIAFA